MRVIHDAASMAEFTGGILVPTMGALHDGHASLIRSARQHAHTSGGRSVVVWIFVNPTQFGDPADLARYPRTLGDDVILCGRSGADVVFAPPATAVYPPGEPIPVPVLPLVAITPGLEDAARPGHFAGVCQVVLRMFSLTRPGAAIFGEKDWQQLQVIRALEAQERLGIQIIPAPTIREKDGLALSSRNRFLSRSDRRRGLALSRALGVAAETRTPAEAERTMHRILTEASVRPDYAVVRDARTLLPITPEAAELARFEGRPLRALVAGRIGSVRLIDNAPWPA